MKIQSRAALFSVFAVFSTISPAAEPGAWDDFATDAHADGWTVYDFFDDKYYFPDWFGGDGGDIYFFHTGDEPLFFFTDVQSDVGGGAFVGDYHAAEIQAIRVEVLIDSLPDFDFLDCVIYASNGPGGAGYYYSQVFLDTDFDEGGWWTLRFGFDETWEYFNGSSYVSTPVTPAMLQSIEEVGFRFFPKIGTTEDFIAAIDNVRLEPRVRAPALAVSAAAGQFQMTFTPPRANSCTVQRLDNVQPAVWSNVAGHTGIFGSAPHLFTTPTASGTGIFRVASSARYVPITP
jgi:hypothetical protein